MVNVAKATAAQLRLAVEAFAERDPARAAGLGDMDDAMDELQKDLFRRIFATQVDDEAASQRAVQIALDHAVNTGERVPFMVTGEFAAEGQHAAEADAQHHTI